MRLLKDFIWEQLPSFYDTHDSYKDGQGKGLLQRFLSIFGSELDEKVIPKLEGIIDELDPETASNEFLSEIAYQLGKPLDILEDIQVYRILLTQIISIYKLKGTTKSYEIFFGILGYTITLTEYYPADNIYDGDIIYDGEASSDEVEAGEEAYHDETLCDIGCTDYSIDYSPIADQVAFTEAQEDKVRTAISLYLEPINANLKDLTFIP